MAESFNFTVFPMNLKELINNWNKIEYLTSLCYPLDYVGSPGYVQAPFLFLTLETKSILDFTFLLNKVGV